MLRRGMASDALTSAAGYCSALRAEWSVPEYIFTVDIFSTPNRIIALTEPQEKKQREMSFH
jgi:hypothetical protein